MNNQWNSGTAPSMVRSMRHRTGMNTSHADSARTAGRWLSVTSEQSRSEMDREMKIMFVIGVTTAFLAGYLFHYILEQGGVPA